MGSGAELAVELLIALINQAATITTLLANAKAAGRDILPSELDGLALADDVARAELVIAIANRRKAEAAQA
jgi:hypothetical protein